MNFRSIGVDGEPWPQWIRELRHASGAYAFKQHGHDGKVVYVGSSEGRLYDTITRHFQQWKRKKQWWKGMRGEGHDPGMVYSRARHCVAIVITSKGQAKVAEGNLIEKLRPVDNLVKDPAGVRHGRDDDEIPF